MTSRWAPLESSPEVLTTWAGLVGLSTNKSVFSDVYGLDDELLALVPQPVKAVLLVFPSASLKESRKASDTKIAEEGQHELSPSIFYIKQTISNACGTIALMHAIYNSDVEVEEDSVLDKFRIEGMGKSPKELATLLETTDLFATAHARAAQEGQSSLPANLDTDDHFIAFVQTPDPKSPGKYRIIELDGMRAGPVDHGESQDFLKDTARVIKEQFLANTDDVTFAMISLGPVTYD